MPRQLLESENYACTSRPPQAVSARSKQDISYPTYTTSDNRTSSLPLRPFSSVPSFISPCHNIRTRLFRANDSATDEVALSSLNEFLVVVGGTNKGRHNQNFIAHIGKYNLNVAASVTVVIFRLILLKTATWHIAGDRISKSRRILIRKGRLIVHPVISFFKSMPAPPETRQL
uniref:hypothetical protein n=1 Tax=Salmonella sp. TaxID=599 RepID=UPI001CDA19F7|nr:hypothetical protein [Salmonella sp.]